MPLVMLEVVPVEERLRPTPCVLDALEALWVIRAAFQGLEVSFHERIGVHCQLHASAIVQCNLCGSCIPFILWLIRSSCDGRYCLAAFCTRWPARVLTIVGVRAISSAGEHSFHTRGVAGTIPALPTNRKRRRRWNRPPAGVWAFLVARKIGMLCRRWKPSSSSCDITAV